MTTTRSGSQIPPARSAVPPTRRYAPMGAVVAASFGAFLALMDSTVVNVAFPSIQSAFPHASVGTLSWVLNSYNVVLAGLLVLAGRFADLLGRRRLFRAGLVVFTITSGLCAASSTVGVLIALRVLQAAGAAMLVPASLGIVIHAAPVERRSHALSMWAAAGALAAGLGPPIGGALVDLYNWRLVFLINVPLGAVAWFMARRMVIESRAPGRRILPDLRGALLLSLGLGSLTFAIVEGGSWGWANPAVVATFAVAVTCALLTVQSSRYHQSPILDPKLLRIRGFLVSTLLTVTAGLGLYTYLLAHILWLHYVWGYSLLLSGLAVAPGAVVAVLVAIPCGKLADRLGPRAVVVPGALVWCGAYIWYSTRVGLTPDFVGQWLPGQILSGIGVGATIPIAASGGLSTVPAGRYATASAVNSSARQLGGVLGIALLTIFIAHPTLTGFPDDIRHGWEMAAGAFAVTAVIALFFGRVRAAHDATVAPIGEPRVIEAPAPLTVTTPPETGPDFLDLLPAATREHLLDAGEPVMLRGGETLFRAGDDGDALYVLRSGRLVVDLAEGTHRDLHPECTIGELALLTDSRRSATVMARRDSTLTRLDRATFEGLLETHPEVVMAVARGIAVRLQTSRPTNPSPATTATVISVAPAGAGVPIQLVADVLERALSSRATVRRLDAGASPDEIQAAEAQADRVLLVGGSTRTALAACLRQADRTVVVAATPDPKSVPDLRKPCDLLLVGTAPTSAQVVGWHDATACRRVHHIGPDSRSWPSALEPLVARLSGTSVALVLAGGGARSLAHLGVLHAFEAAGIQVDRVAGTSMGAFIAALHATGASAAEVDERVFEEFVRRNPFGDYRPSVTSLARGERGRAMLRRSFGESHLETLQYQLVVASTDLYERSPVYLERGETVEAVGASMCLPVFFPPQQVAGRVLVDGTLTDNCPTGPYCAVPEGPVVAVRIGSSAPRSRERTPTLGETLLRIIQMGDREESRTPGLPPPTVTVTPDTRGVGLLEFHQIDRAREAGRQAGQAAIAALRDHAISHSSEHDTS